MSTIQVGEVKVADDRLSATVELIARNELLDNQREDLLSQQASDAARLAAIKAGLPPYVGDGGLIAGPYAVTVDGQLAGTVKLNGETLPLTHPKNRPHHYRAVMSIK